VLFLVVLFLIKNGFLSKNSISSLWNKDTGLIYDTTTIGELVYKDTDGDTIPDWEENLWGTDPTKKETTPGIPDTTVISKLKASQEPNLENEKNLTETDKFSRELFSAIASLTQTGTLDQATADKIGASLSEKIQNPAQKKVYTLADIKVIQDDSLSAVKKYNDTLDNIIEKKYPIKGNVVEILARFLVDENNVDPSVLAELGPIIEQRNKIISAILSTEVPKSLSFLHLGLINALEKYSESLSAIKLFDTDPIIALGGISQLEENINLMDIAIEKLKQGIQKN
jgi:hypothetical protein